MASLIYDSMMEDLVRGAIDFDTDKFYVALVTSSYTANKATHKKRSAIAGGEVGTTGTGYSTGGQISNPTLTLDTTLHKMDIQFAPVTWSNATITANACVIYKLAAGTLPGVAADDPLVAYVDFGQNVSSTAAAFAVTFSSSLRFQN